MKKFLIILGIAFCGYAFSMESLEDIEKKSYTAKELGLNIDAKLFKAACEFEEDLQKAINGVQNKKILGISKGKDIVVTIGNTGAGKSTLLNLLIGKELKATNVGYELVKQCNSKYFEIGTGTTSQTLLPQLVEHNNMIFIDLPGLRDNRGEGVALGNAVCIKDIVTNARSVRFLFVESKGSLESNRGESLKKSFNIIEDLLPESKNLVGSSILVITQAPKGNQQTFIKFLMKKFDDEDGLQMLDEIFFLRKESPYIFPFQHSENFADEDENGDITIDNKKVQLSLGNTKKCIEQGINILKGIKVQEINAATLLMDGTEDKLHILMKILAARSFFPLFSQEANLVNFSKNQLQNLQKSLYDDKKTFIKKMSSKPEFTFIEIFDIELHKRELKTIFIEIEERIEKLYKNVETKILEVDNEELKKQNAQLADKSRKAVEIIRASKEHQQLCLSIESLFDKKEKDYQAWQEEKRYRETRSGFNTVLKGIFSLGLHSIAHDGLQDRLKSDYENTKESLQAALKRYELNLQGERHWRHDEVL